MDAYRESDDYFSKSKFVIELQPSSFDSEATWKLREHKCSAVLFYAPWCPHCKAMKETWEQLGETAAFYDVCAFNCEKHKEHVAKIKEDMPELVRGYPTMILYKQGVPVENVGTTTEDRTLSRLVEACARGCKS
jgi:thioredoxin-like negative regulator of GroEL